MNEIRSQYEGGEDPEKPLSYVEIEDQLTSGAVLFKPYDLGRESLERLVRRIGLDPDIEQKLLQIPAGRNQAHLIRLLEHGGVEATFAVAYIKHADSAIPPGTPQSDAVYDVINSEGSDTTLFWTFAPYLFQALSDRGVDAAEAIRLTLYWAKNGVSVVNGRRSGGDWGKAHLKGLEFINEHQTRSYILTGNANDPSHKFTAQEANRIADMLIVENNEK